MSDISTIGQQYTQHARRQARAERLEKAYRKTSTSAALTTFVDVLEEEAAELPADEAHAKQRDVLARVRGALRWEAQLLAMITVAAGVLTEVFEDGNRGWAIAEDLVRNVMAGRPERRSDVERLLAGRFKRMAACDECLREAISDAHMATIASVVAAQWTGVVVL